MAEYIEDRDARSVVESVISEWHRGLTEGMTTVTAMFAMRDQETGESPIRLAGCETPVASKSTSEKLRCQGHRDIEVMIDPDWWSECSERRKRAIADYAIRHYDVVVKETRDGARVKRDSNGRPKLKRLPYDAVIGFYHGSVGDHGSDAVEVQQLLEIFKRHPEYLTALGLQWVETPDDSHAE